MAKKKSTQILKYDVVFEEAEEGGYTVIVPSLPGCISEGDTFEEAKNNIAEAIKLYLEDLKDEGEELPSDNNDSIFIGEVKINLDRPSAAM